MAAGAAAALLALAPLPAAAAADQAVEQVIVTGIHFPPAVGDAAFSSMTLDADALLQSPRLDESLEQVPGLSLFRRSTSANANPTTQGVSLRAIAPSGAGRTLVLLDGVPLNDPFGNWVIWAALPPEDIGAAEIVRGAGAGPYGAGALTGTISLSERDTTDGIAAADADAGSLDSLRAAASGGATIGKTDFFGSLSAQRSDGWIPVSAAQRGPADNHLWLDSGSASLRGETMFGDVSAAARIGAYDVAQGAGLVGAQAKSKGLDASLVFARAAAPGSVGWRLQGWAIRSTFSNTSDTVLPLRAGTVPANDQYATPATGFGFNAAALGASGYLHWEAGGDLRVNSGESDELFTFTSGHFTKHRRSGGKLLVGGLYGEAAIDTSQWLLTLGVRADYWATSQGHLVEQLRSTGAVTNFQDYPGRDAVVPTARGGLRRNFDDGQYLRAAGYIGFRPPSLNELYRPFRVGNNTTQANASLKPEQLAGLEAGWGGEAGDFSWNATAFWNRLHDAIANATIASTLTSTTFRRENIGDIDAVGLEGDAAYRLSDELSLRAAFSLTDARVKQNPASVIVGVPSLTGNRPAQAPIDTVTAGLRWRPLDRVGFNADLRWESSRFEDDQNSLRLGSAVVIDLYTDYHVTDALSAYLALDNALGANIATGETVDHVISFGAPREVRVGLRYAP